MNWFDSIFWKYIDLWADLSQLFENVSWADSNQHSEKPFDSWAGSIQFYEKFLCRGDDWRTDDYF